MDLGKKDIGVLIAEDDFLIADEIIRIIKKLGYKHLGVAGNGQKATEMALKLNPDVILMDIKMPKMSGLEVAKKIVDDAIRSSLIGRCSSRTRSGRCCPATSSSRSSRRGNDRFMDQQ